MRVRAAPATNRRTSSHPRSELTTLGDESRTDGEPQTGLDRQPRYLGPQRPDRKLCVLASRRVCPWWNPA